MWLVSLLVLIAAVTIATKLRGRPVVDGAQGDWTWALSLLFVAGIAVAVTRPPSLTCPSGYRLDEGFALCIRGASRFGARSWTWLKDLVFLVAIALGATVIRSTRAIPITAAVAAAAWCAGIGWLLRDLFLR